MKKTAEAVSLGHPDKISDYISSYVLDRIIEMDAYVKYAVEVLVKDNTVVLGGEISGNVDFTQLDNWVKDAIREIGYDERYNKIWGDFALNINKINVVNMIGLQSPDINRGIQNNGWGDQGVFVGYACRGVGMISRELYLARKINNALYNNARRSDNLGLDIKTQVTIDDNDEIDTVVVAIPMLHPVDLSEFIVKELGGRPKKLIINGTGVYQYHSSVADCGVTGRKLACDFYSVTCPIGGGAPWTKDATKADLTLNLYARQLAIESLHDNDECTVFLSSCIGLSELPSARICIVKDGQIQVQELALDLSPEELISKMDLRRPCFASMCRNGFIDIKHVSL